MSDRRVSTCSTCRHWSEDDDPGDDGCCSILLNTPNVRGFRTMPNDTCIEYAPGLSFDEKDVCDLIETGIQHGFLTGSNEYVARRAQAEIQSLCQQLATARVALERIVKEGDAGESIWLLAYDAIEALAAKGG